MALLGAQLVVTLVMISVIQKLGPHFSFARWLLCSTGLVRYLYPTDSELRHLASIPKTKKGGKVPVNGKTSVDTFHIPRSLDVRLDTAKVTALDVIQLRFYTEYQWFVDFTLYSIIVYVITEIYQAWFPLKDEMNLSMMWSTLVLLFSIKLLLSLTVQYFKGEESVGERSTCIVMGFTYLLISMMILIVDENTLELGLEDAYNSFNKSASLFLTNQGLNSSGPASKIVLKFFMALWCGILGALFTFPGLRVAKMHWDLLKHYREQRSIQTLLNVNFALPFILVILWIKPVARTYLTERIFSGMEQPLMTTHAFDSLRVIVIVTTMCVKLAVMPWYLQAYLNMAYTRTEEQKKEAGRITNIEFQKKIAAVFYYLCVVTLQYVAPIVMCLILTLMFKTLGGYTWSGLFSEPLNPDECPLAPPAPTEPTIDPFASDESIAQSAADFHLALNSLKSVFSTEVLKGLFGFWTWWCCFIYFATTSVGLIYQSYFSTA